MHDARARKRRGVLVVAALPNTLEHPRLGLSVGVRVGPATVRNRCKRLIREAFRLEQHALPRSITGGYDLVVGVRPVPSPPEGSRKKEVLPPLATVRRLLVELVEEADAEWRRRARREESKETDPQP